MQGYWYYSSYFSFVHSRNKASLSLLYWFGSHSSENIRLLSLLWWTVLCIIITGCITFLAWLVGVIGAATGGVFPCAAKLWIFCVQMFSFGVWSELLKVNFFKTERLDVKYSELLWMNFPLRFLYVLFLLFVAL